MAVIVMIYGESGTGKSTSLRNFQPGECSVINVSKKPLPFRNQLPVAKTDDYKVITDLLQKSKSKSLVIDDATYLMTNEFMRTAKVTGFQKFTDMAKNFFDMLQTAINLPDDKIVYVMGHVERDQFGNESFKSIGKLLSEKVTLEGLFTIVLKTVVKDGRYQFATQTNGMDTVKSPMGMFEQTLIDNDLKAVDKQIRDYYGI